MEKMWTMDQEAQYLRERFASVKNRAKWARTHGVKGGGAIIYQHMNGYTPISLDAAKAYARGFGCALDDISPRLAREAASALSMVRQPEVFRPPVIEDHEWNALSIKRREFIERVALTAMTDTAIDALKGVLDAIVGDPPQATIKQTPTRAVIQQPATAVKVGPPSAQKVRIHKINVQRKKTA